MMKEYKIETAWDELTPSKFKEVVNLLFDAGSMAKAELRFKILEILVGEKLPKPKVEICCHQCLAEWTKFVFSISINDDVVQVLSNKLKNILTYALPDEIDDKTLLKELETVKSIIQPKFGFNLALTSNLLPEISIGKKKFHGPVFNIDKFGILETDITVGEYLDAYEYQHIYAQTKDTKYLANMAACLYRQNRQKYNTFEAQQRAILFQEHLNKELKAIWFMLICWQNYFYNHPVFGILFSGSGESDPDKISLGSYGHVYTMSKDGYGKIDDVVMMPITDFFNIQVKSIQEAVVSLRGMKKNNGEISIDLKLPIETVLKL